MKALVKLRPEKGIWMEDIPTPHVGINDVLIKIKKTAHTPKKRSVGCFG